MIASERDANVRFDYVSQGFGTNLLFDAQRLEEATRLSGSVGEGPTRAEARRDGR